MKLLLTFLTLFPLTVFCQSNDTTKTKTKRMAIGLTFSPDYCYRTLKSDASHQWIADAVNARETPKLGFTAGLGFVFQLNKRLALETGLQFSDKGEKTKPISLLSVPPDPNSPIKVTYTNHYNYLDIPVKINYNILTTRLKLFVSGGLSANFFLFQKITAIEEYSDGHSKKSSSTGGQLSRINLSAVAGLGVTYDLTERLSFRLEPTYRQAITPMANTPIKEYLYSAGVHIGVYFKL